MPPLRAVNLRHRITIRHAVEQQDPDTGGLIDVWADGATLWAQMEALDGREAMIDHVLRGVSMFRVTIRWRDDVDVQNRVRHAGKELNITSAVDPDGSRERLVILATTEGVGA